MPEDRLGWDPRQAHAILQAHYSLSDTEFMQVWIMLCPRRNILGMPNVYFLRMSCAMAHPVFSDEDESRRFHDLLASLVEGFRIRLFSFRVEASQVELVLRHDTTSTETDERLRRSWQKTGGRSTSMSTPRLRRRLGSLDGFMQTLAQRFSRDWNRRHGHRGHLWAGRYRACLLADDAALLAAVAWCEDQGRQGTIATSQGLHGSNRRPQLAALPLRLAPGDLVLPSDESPPGCAPIPDQDMQPCFDRFCAGLLPSCRIAYGLALTRGLALGRPESLSETLARLGRATGRGRSRKLRDLDDHQGLCGVWG
jgi:hypothetical protein